MNGPPPENLMEWPKAKLAREVARLRAILYEHADAPADEPTSGGDFADVAGDPHARGGVVIDARDSVLMDSIDVVLVDTKQDDEPRMVLILAGRVNYSTRRTRQMFQFGADGAAGIATQLIGLAARAGGKFRSEFEASYKQRVKELP